MQNIINFSQITESVKKQKKPFQCKYCNHSFVKESTLLAHVCEPKRRALAKNSTHVMIAYSAFNTFYRQTQYITKDKTYEEFCSSPFYKGFVKYGSFVHNVAPLYPKNYLNYLITNGIKLDEWSNESTYTKYVVSLIKTETVETALERSIQTMLAWGTNHSTQWNQYLTHASPSRVTYDIKDGKISPWLVLNSRNGISLIKKLDDTMLNELRDILDIPFWQYTFQHRPLDTKLAKEIIQGASI